MKKPPYSQLKSARTFIFLSFAFLLNSFALPVQGPDKLCTTINEKGVKLKENEVVLVVGSAGCGKSTFIAAMNNEMILNQKRDFAVKGESNKDTPKIAFSDGLTTQKCKPYKDGVDP